MLQYLEKNKDITKLSNFKTPARAQYFYEFSREEDIELLFDVYTWAQQHNLPTLLISGGTNMLFAFEEFQGLVIYNNFIAWRYDRTSHILESSGAASIWSIAQALEDEYQQTLWHRFIGLPGSVAGAIYGNAGCFGLETENNFLDCKVLDIVSGQVSTFTKSDMDFSYRSSRIKKEKKYFIISARFDLSKKIEKYHSDVDNIDFRENKQPKGNSCGSFFKNPKIDTQVFWEQHPELFTPDIKAISAGFLLEHVGMKGYSIAGASFSEKHANFLMHDGKGSYKDMLELISIAQKKVEEKFGIYLENEVQIIR